MMPLLLAVGALFAQTEPAPAPEGYGIAQVVLRQAEDWDAFAPALCSFQPAVVVVVGAAPEAPALSCGARVHVLAREANTALTMDDDVLYLFADDASGHAEGTLQRERRARKSARFFFVASSFYTPLDDPRVDLILQSDDAADAILAGDSGITDGTAEGVRPFGRAKVYASGTPEESSFRAYWVDASGLRPLAPAVPLSGLSSLELPASAAASSDK
ncbi:MAG: hypothetical protein GC168_18205 [Candidatus Hydrogenedens sp.]|nr:hypothetical protein [Candidatus Hydrogenedens sp.]